MYDIKIYDWIIIDENEKYVLDYNIAYVLKYYCLNSYENSLSINFICLSENAPTKTPQNMDPNQLVNL